MSEALFACSELAWDTEYFGVRSGKVDLFDAVDEAGQDEVLRFCAEHEFVTIRNHGSRAENNRWIGLRTNAFLADMNVRFEMKSDSKLNCAGSRDSENSSAEGRPVECAPIAGAWERVYGAEDSGNRVRIRNFMPPDEGIEAIAGKAFLNSRFRKDPRLLRDRAEGLHVRWVHNAFERADRFFAVYEREGAVAGFTLVSFPEDGAVIELIAVDERFRGQKIGKAMIGALRAFAEERGVRRIAVGTQADNVTAVRFYGTMGFTYADCAAVYHLWTK